MKLFTQLSASILVVGSIVGCQSAPAPAAKEPAKPAATYPARPTVAPPAFTVLHYNVEAAAFTLVTKEDATNDEIEALVWQIRDAARAGTLASLKMKSPEGAKDVRAHIYRGKKCATEKYGDGPLPCSAAYHGSGDYSMSKLPNKIWDKGTLRDPETGKETELWDPDAAYVAPVK